MVSSRRNPSSQDADLLQRARRLEESALALIFDT